MTVIAWVASGEKIGFVLIFKKGKTTFKIPTNNYGWLWFVYYFADHINIYHL